MIFRKFLIILTSILLLCFTKSEETSIDTARKIVKEFGSKLKSELMQAMKRGGPVPAIQVCQNKAPQIAKEISDSTGWEIGRTSLKIRNSANKPNEWEKTVLENFEKKLQLGNDINNLEHSEVIETDGVKYFKYMKAIPTGSICLNCHGSDIKDEVKKKISELYLDDKAVDYKKGEIRGAFTLKKIIQ